MSRSKRRRSRGDLTQLSDLTDGAAVPGAFSRTDPLRLVWLLVFASSLVAFGLGIALPPYWGNAAELVAVASGQVAVPVMVHPVWLTLAWPWSVVPNGWAWFSVFCSAASVTLLFQTALGFQHERFRWERAWRARGGARSAFFVLIPALAVAVVVAASPLLLREATRPSLFTLHLLLLTATAFLGQKLSSDRMGGWWRGFWFILGLALVELAMAWVALPLLLVWLVLKRWKLVGDIRRDAPVWRGAAFFLCLGGSALLWRPILFAVAEPDKLAAIGGWLPALKMQLRELIQQLTGVSKYVQLVPWLFCVFPALVVVVRWDRGGHRPRWQLALLVLATLGPWLYLAGWLPGEILPAMFQSFPTQAPLFFCSAFALSYLLGAWLILTDGGFQEPTGPSLVGQRLGRRTWGMATGFSILALVAALTSVARLRITEERAVRALVELSLESLPAGSTILIEPESLAHAFMSSVASCAASQRPMVLPHPRWGRPEWLKGMDIGFPSRDYASAEMSREAAVLLRELAARGQVYTNLEDPPTRDLRPMPSGGILHPLVPLASPQRPAVWTPAAWWETLVERMGPMGAVLSPAEAVVRRVASRSANEVAVAAWCEGRPLGEVERVLEAARCLLPLNPAVLGNLEVLARKQGKEAEAERWRKERVRIVRAVGINPNPLSWSGRFGWVLTDAVLAERIRREELRGRWTRVAEGLAAARRLGVARMATVDSELTMLVATGRASEAVELVKRAVEGAPMDAPGKRAGLLRQGVRACLLAQQWDLANRWMAEADFLDPIWAKANLFRGEVFLAEGRYAEAERHLTRYCESHPSDLLSAHVALSTLKLKTAKPNEALALLKQVEPSAQRDPRWQIARASVDLELGLKSEALRRVKDLLASGHESPQARALMLKIESHAIGLEPSHSAP